RPPARRPSRPSCPARPSRPAPAGPPAGSVAPEPPSRELRGPRTSSGGRLRGPPRTSVEPSPGGLGLAREGEHQAEDERHRADVEPQREAERAGEIAPAGHQVVEEDRAEQRDA